MRNYQKLLDGISSEKISIRMIISLFRSHSTALTIALSQSEQITGQISEPFVHDDLSSKPFEHDSNSEKNYRSFDRGCENIIRACQGSPVENILIKEMSANLIKPEFDLLLPVVSHFIFTIREPKLQSLSLLTRFTNDILSEKFCDNLSVASVLRLYDPQVAMIDKRKILLIDTDSVRSNQILSFIGKNLNSVLSDDDIALACQKVMDLTIHVAFIAWDNLLRIVKQLQKANHNNYIIIDGSELLENSTALLKLVTSSVDLEFNDFMVNEWRKATGESYNSSVGPLLSGKAHTNCWTGPAIHSKFFKNHESSMPITISLSTLPESLQKFIDSINKNYYQPLRDNTQFISTLANDNALNSHISPV